MELIGEQLIQAPRPAVWAAINDPEALSRCIPGCEEIIAESDTERRARVMLKIGPVRARFSGRLTLSDIDAPSSCRITFEGAGGAAGFAKGESAIELMEEGAATRLRYTVSASVGGKLGQIGGRLIDASSKKLADEFFTALNSLLTNDAADTAAPSPSAPAPAPAQAAVTTAPMRPVPAASSAPTPQPTFPTGWSGELTRAFWFALGVGTTLLSAYLLR